jgi:hypothetical protein
VRNLARVKKKVLAFSWSTNQTMTVTFKVENQILDESLKWLDTFGVNSFIEYNQVTCSRWLCSRRKWKLTWWHPHLMKIESYGIWFEGNQLKRFKLRFHLNLS